MEFDFCGLILEVSYPDMGNTAKIDVLGKSMLEWVSLALGDNFYRSLPCGENVNVLESIKPYLQPELEFTVVLYTDAPLISRKSVLDAIATLKQNNLNVLKLTRGYVFRTSYILNVERVYSERTYFFDEEDFIMAFNFKQLAMIRELLKNRILNFHMEQGVNIADMSNTYIGPDVIIGNGVIIEPNNHIIGKTIIKNNVKIGPNNIIQESILDEGVSIDCSNIKKCFIGAGSKVGPYSYIRPDSIIGKNCRIGDFVEIKNSIIGENCKVAHLSYVGDCEMGNDCNVGCGVVFANYDGRKKHKSIVGNHVFIGSNSNIIAPLTIGSNSFIAAGSTVDKNVPEDALAIARARQENKPGWKSKH